MDLMQAMLNGKTVRELETCPTNSTACSPAEPCRVARETNLWPLTDWAPLVDVPETDSCQGFEMTEIDLERVMQYLRTFGIT